MLVFVPGHRYLVFYLDAEHQHFVGLETTLIGSESDGELTQLPGNENIVDDEWQQANSWATFCAAVVVGNQSLTANLKKFSDKADTDYQLIPIVAARKLGILPISFNSTDKFESAAGPSN